METSKNSFRQPCGLPRNMPLAYFSSEREAEKSVITSPLPEGVSAKLTGELKIELLEMPNMRIIQEAP